MSNTTVCIVSDPICRSSDTTFTYMTLAGAPLMLLFIVWSYKQPIQKWGFIGMWPIVVFATNYIFKSYLDSFFDAVASTGVIALVVRYLPLAAVFLFVFILTCWTLGVVISPAIIAMVVLVKTGMIANTIASGVILLISLLIGCTKWFQDQVRIIVLIIGCTAGFAITFASWETDDSYPQCGGERSNILLICNKQCPIATDTQYVNIKWYILGIGICAVVCILGMCIPHKKKQTKPETDTNKKPTTRQRYVKVDELT
jgi:hypothetical protein